MMKFFDVYAVKKEYQTVTVFADSAEQAVAIAFEHQGHILGGYNSDYIVEECDDETYSEGDVDGYCILANIDNRPLATPVLREVSSYKAFVF
ncbi:MAG: hypothetical protein WCJ64_06685 [Rhodospirillaceae bacterium]